MEKSLHHQSVAKIVGLLFIVGTVAGIMSVVLAGNIFSETMTAAAFSASKLQFGTGALFVLVMGFSLAMVPVVLYPLLKTTHPRLAMGSVVFRGTLESVFYILIAATWLLAVKFVENGQLNPFSDPNTFSMLKYVLGTSNVVLSLMVSFVFSIGTFMMYYCFYQTKLLPKWLSLWGVFGAVLYILYPLLAVYNVDWGLLMMPLAIQEMVMGVWLLVKGFNNNTIAD